MERGAAGYEHLELWAGGHQLAEGRGGGHHLLEVIEDEQQLPVAQGILEGLQERPPAQLVEAEGLADGRQDEAGVLDGGQRDKADAVAEVVAQGRCHLQGQAGLADAAGAGEGEQADLLAQQLLPDGGDRLGAADQTGARMGEAAG